MQHMLRAFVLLLVLVTQASHGQWSIEQSDSLVAYHQIRFTDSLHGFLVGDRSGVGGIVSITTNGGASWVEKNIGPESLRSLSVENKFIWISTDHGKVYWSQDSGSTWTSRFSDDTTYTFQTIYFVDSLRGWLLGDYNGIQGVEIILHSSDGGLTWVQQYKSEPLPFGHLYQGHFVDSLRGWAAHQYYVMNTVDGGKNWNSQTVPEAPFLKSVSFLDTSRGWAVGDDGIRGYVIFTTDGGQHWSRGNTTMNATVLSVSFADSLKGWVCCSDGLIASTTDGGRNWTNQQSNVKGSLESIFFLNDNTGWAVGKNGTILSTTNGGGITSMRSVSRLPVAFSLSQNFPNPFNPTTRIQYSLGAQSYVDIKVYDLLGQLTVTLLKGWKDAGIYFVEFDGSALPSGVYFYRLSTHNMQGMSYLETKKMMLLH